MVDNHSQNQSSDAVVQRFCLAPGSRCAFNAFFEFCVWRTIAYLKALYRKGYPLPIQRENLDKAYHDIAVDCLPRLFASNPGRPYYPIFDFFARRGITDFSAVTEERVRAELMTLLRSNARQALYKRECAENPEVAALKRNLKDALKGAEYSAVDDPDGAGVLYYTAGAEARLRPDRPLLAADELYALVFDAYNHETSMDIPPWLRKVFAGLAELDHARNALRYEDLIAAILAVINTARRDHFENSPESNPGVEAMLFELVAAEIPGVLDWVHESVIQPFVLKKKLEAGMAGVYLRAVEERLLDFAAGSESIVIPKYLYAQVPGLDSPEYLGKYKYTFETTMKKAIERMREILQKNPTIRSLRDYLS